MPSTSLQAARSPLPRRLRELRLAAGISQKELGMLIGIDQFAASPRVNQYERGVHEPKVAVAMLLAATLNSPTAYLYTDDDDLAGMILAYHRAPAVSARMKKALAAST